MHIHNYPYVKKKYIMYIPISDIMVESSKKLS
jgi:hypothetical protein